MSFSTRCTFCRKKIKAPDEVLGFTLRCPRCGCDFVLTPSPKVIQAIPRNPAPLAAPDDATNAADSIEESTRAVAGMDDKAPTPATTTPSPKRYRQEYLDEYTGTRAGDELSSDLVGAAGPIGAMALIMGAAALLFASFHATAQVTIPLALGACLVGLAALQLTRRVGWSTRLLPLSGLGVGLFVTIVATCFPALLGPTYEQYQGNTPTDAAFLRVIPLDLKFANEQLEMDGWALADRAALQQEPVRVQVALVSGGMPESATEKVQASSKYISVVIRIQHIGGRQAIDYHQWLPVGDKAQAMPTLIDHSGTRYPLKNKQVRARLFPGKALEDLLVFEPESLAAGPLRLELPAYAWGGNGSLRFLIPATMRQR